MYDQKWPISYPLEGTTVVDGGGGSGRSDNGGEAFVGSVAGRLSNCCSACHSSISRQAGTIGLLGAGDEETGASAIVRSRSNATLSSVATCACRMAPAAIRDEPIKLDSKDGAASVDVLTSGASAGMANVTPSNERT